MTMGGRAVATSLLGCCVIIFGVVDAAKLARRERPSVILSDNAFCENQLSAFFVSDNTAVTGVNASATIKNVRNESTCIDYCSNNRDDKGRLVFCASAIYDAKIATCRLYRKSGAPDGELQHQIELGLRYLEKFCLAEDLPTECANKQYIRVDDYILKGYAQSTIIVPSLADCVAQCVREKEFVCKSAMYFYEEGECITNLESAITRPDDFMKPDDEDKVIFFHNGCVQHVAVVETSESNDEENEEVEEENAVNETTDDVEESMVVKGDAEVQTAEVSTTTKLEPSSSIITIAATTTKSSTLAPTTTVAVAAAASVVTTTTTTVVEEATTKSLRLAMKEKIRPIVSVTTTSAPIVSTTTIIAPTEAESEIQKQHKVRNIETRLFAAKHLESEANQASQLSSTNTTIASIDDGPERPPSGHLAVEDMVAHNAENADKMLQKATPNDLRKPAPSPPSIEPPLHFQLSNRNQQQHNVDLHEHQKQLELTPPPLSLPSSSTVGPRALMPKILVEEKQRQDGNKDTVKASTLSFAESPTSTAKPGQKLLEAPVAAGASVPQQLLVLDSEAGTAASDSGKVEQVKQLQLKPIKTLTPSEDFEFFSTWGEWTPCQEAGERRIRRRKCLDLRRCRGALMQVDYCPHDLPPQEDGEFGETSLDEAATSGPVGPGVRNPLPIEQSSTSSAGSPPSILPNKLPEKELKPLPVGAPGRPDDIWSPWLGSCQHFASIQPCKNNQVIGFESRECIAKDPKACIGPFFRYCTLPC